MMIIKSQKNQVLKFKLYLSELNNSLESQKVGEMRNQNIFIKKKAVCAFSPLFQKVSFCKIIKETQLKKCRLRPYSVWYNYFFGKIKARWNTWWGIFSIDKRDILKYPVTKYQHLILTVNDHFNPEAGHYIERSWGAIFYPLLYTIKEQE